MENTNNKAWDIHDLMQKGAPLATFMEAKQNNVDLDVKDAHGNSVLHTAIEKERMELIGFFYYKMQSPGAVNEKGQSPLDLAQHLEMQNVVDFFHEAMREAKAAKADCPSQLGQKESSSASHDLRKVTRIVQESFLPTIPETNESSPKSKIQKSSARASKMNSPLKLPAL